MSRVPARHPSAATWGVGLRMAPPWSTEQGDRYAVSNSESADSSSAESAITNAAGQGSDHPQRLRLVFSHSARSADLDACAQNGTAAATAPEGLFCGAARSRRDGYDLLAYTGLPLYAGTIRRLG